MKFPETEKKEMKMQFFDDLPSANLAGNRNIDWTGARRELVANPGRWGLLVENIASSAITQLRNGQNVAFRVDLDCFEFSARRPKNPETPYGPYRTDIYGRYTPKEAGDA